MLKEHLVYKDFEGNRRERDFYFNLTAQEISEMELSLNGGLHKFMEKVAQEEDQARLVQYFKEFLLKSYGKKSNDGENFVKNDQIREEFQSSMAFNEFWMRFVTEKGAFENFIKGVIPADLDKYTQEQNASNKSDIKVVGNINNPAN